MFTRRQILLGAGAFWLTGAGFGGYAFAIEPYRLVVRRYRVRPEGWPAGLKLRLVGLADLHICEPWMSLERVQAVVAQANDLQPDLFLLLGDFVGSRRLAWSFYDRALWARALAGLRAPLGVHAVLGNHDWWDDLSVQRQRSGTPAVQRALEEAGIPVYENDARRMTKDGHPFWLCGLGDQWAYFQGTDSHDDNGRFTHLGVDDLAATLARLDDDAPAIMMVHEPDIFTEIPERIGLTLAGHTHGGQVQLFGYAPIVPSYYGRRYAYGHIVEDDRHLIVSGGIGCSNLPIRFGRPPEIVVVDLEG